RFVTGADDRPRLAPHDRVEGSSGPGRTGGGARLGHGRNSSAPTRRAAGRPAPWSSGGHQASRPGPTPELRHRVRQRADDGPAVAQTILRSNGIGACRITTPNGRHGQAGTAALGCSFSIARTIARTPFSVETRN